MSGSSSDVLKEYMVKLTYQVNAASQASFVRSLVESATSSSQAASSMYRLGMAVANMARGMAEAGDKLYWMGQRLQSSVQGIESATYAMTQLGASAGEAHSAMEGVGNFVRSYGPAASQYLRSIGVTATDAAARMSQLGAHLRSMGFAPGREGTTGYAMGRNLIQMLGVNEDAARAAASGEFDQRMRERQALQERAGLNSDVWDKSAKRLMTVFRQFDSLLDVIWKKFGQDIMPGLTEDFEKIYAVLYKHIPEITAFFNTMGKAIKFVVDLFVVFVETIDKLDATSIKMIEIFAGVLVAVRALSAGLLASPLFWFITALTTLLLLMDDYNHWKNDQKNGTNTSAFDWSGFEGMKTGIDKWGEDVLGVCNLFQKILVTMGLLFAAPMLLGLARTAAAVAGIGGAASGLLGFLMRIAPLLALLSFIGPAGGENKEWSEEKNKEFLREREKHKNDPGFLEWMQKWIYDNLPDKTGPAGRSLNPYRGGSGEGGTSTPPGAVSTNTANAGFMTAQSGSKPSGQELLEYLMSPQGGGWTNVQAAGIIGNLMQESGLNPNAIGDGGAAYGMAQWHPDRQARFQERFGKPIQQASWREQIDFLNWELGNTESRAGNALRGAGSIETATMAALGMERPKDWNTNPGELNRRLPFARAALLPGSVSGQPMVAGGGGGVGLPGGWQPGAPMGGAGGVTINQKTDINITPGPTSADTAQRVAGAQTRVNESLVRNTRTALR